MLSLAVRLSLFLSLLSWSVELICPLLFLFSSTNLFLFLNHFFAQNHFNTSVDNHFPLLNFSFFPWLTLISINVTMISLLMFFFAITVSLSLLFHHNYLSFFFLSASSFLFSFSIPFFLLSLRLFSWQMFSHPQFIFTILLWDIFSSSFKTSFFLSCCQNNSLGFFIFFLFRVFFFFSSVSFIYLVLFSNYSYFTASDLEHTESAAALWATHAPKKTFSSRSRFEATSVSFLLFRAKCLPLDLLHSYSFDRIRFPAAAAATKDNNWCPKKFEFDQQRWNRMPVINKTQMLLLLVSDPIMWLPL